MADIEDGAGGSTPDTEGGVLTRGFLFADLRGYTSFVESRGASAAAKLLDRYRRLVREEVARFRGAEIKTEGDSFYVVFGSVSRAVECALGIVEGAARATDTEPENPVRVGIGVHAGETVETAEGFVGSAVNVAARLCAAAAAGEVLVSDTVRAITANTSLVGYESMGRRRLKGIDSPVAVYRAVSADTPIPPPRPRRMPLVAAGVAGLAVVMVLIGIVLRTPADGPSANSPASSSGNITASGSASSPPSVDPIATPIPKLPVGLLPSGEYTSVWMEPDVTFMVGDGWALVDEQNQAIQLTSSAAPGRDLFVTTFEDPIEPDNPNTHVADVRSAADLVDWLTAHPYLAAEQPISVDLHGSRGLSVDFTADIPESATQPGCPIACIALYWVREGASSFDRFGIIDGSSYRLIALDRPPVADVVALVVVIEVQRPDEFDAFAAEAQAVVSSLRFSSGD
jgi:class 3 adenylate cyclase